MGRGFEPHGAHSSKHRVDNCAAGAYAVMRPGRDRSLSNLKGPLDPVTSATLSSVQGFIRRRSEQANM